MRIASAIGVMLLAAAPAQACRLALLMAVDVSRSISLSDYAIQQQGLLLALADPTIRAALLDTADPVAMAIFEWSGRSDQRVLLDWTLVRTPADLARVEDAVIAGHLRTDRQATALGRALEFARQLMFRAPDCAEAVVDVSGDGKNNAGPTPAEAYAAADWGGIRVNGLAIGEHEADLTDYYRSDVIRGTAAFVEIAPRQTDYPQAIRRKLIRELTEMVLGQGEGRGRSG